MLKWAKVIDNKTKEVQIGTGQNPDFYKSIGMEELEVEQSYLGNWYLKGYAPVEPTPSHEDIIHKRIKELEKQLTDRNIRSAILDDEFALNKISDIEAKIAELRRSLME